MSHTLGRTKCTSRFPAATYTLMRFVSLKMTHTCIQLPNIFTSYGRYTFADDSYTFTDYRRHIFHACGSDLFPIAEVFADGRYSFSVGRDFTHSKFIFIWQIGLPFQKADIFMSCRDLFTWHGPLHRSDTYTS